jgi:outer membrane protein assembly factor BamB
MQVNSAVRRAKYLSVIVPVAAALVVLHLTAQGPPPSSQANTSAALSRAVGPFIRQNCLQCHNSSLPSANIDLGQLLALLDSLARRHDVWQNVAYQIRVGSMPPAGTPKPAKADADAALELIGKALAATPAATAPTVTRKVASSTPDWLTFSYDPERTGWDRAETKISKATASGIRLLWRLQTDTVPVPVNRYETLTDLVVANNVPTRGGLKQIVFAGSHDNTLYAIDGERGTVLWKRTYPNTEKPPMAASGNCPNNMNATPVIDRQSGIIYFLPTDGKLRGVAISDGEDRFPATSIVPPYSRNFSLNLSDGRIFTSTARGCANAISEVVGISVNSPDHTISHFYTSPGKASGPWGRGGIVRTPFGWLAQTADGAYDPAAGRWGSSIVGLNMQGIVTDSFTPANQEEIDARDFDLGSSSPVVFPFDDRTLVASAAKEGVIYLLDAKNLGGKDHRTPLYKSPRYSNDAMAFTLNGMWSVLSTYADAQGKRWLLAPFYGPAAKHATGLFPKTHGVPVNGELMAFTVEGTGAHPMLKPQWMSADLDLPGIAVIANDVILILANGDRASIRLPGGRGRGGPDGPGGPGAGRGGAPRQIPLAEVNPAEPGYERDAAWRASQLKPFETGGQKPGTRFTGGRDTMHAVLYALDPATGDDLYSSSDAIDSWNHDGNLAVSDGKIFLSTWDARLFAFGLKKK